MTRHSRGDLRPAGAAFGRRIRIDGGPASGGAARAAATRSSTSSSTAPTSRRASRSVTRRACCATSRGRSPTSSASPRGKRIVRFYEDAWELCVERLASTATLSVYRGGAEPTVLVYDRAVVFEEMCASVIDALDATIARHAARLAHRARARRGPPRPRRAPAPSAADFGDEVPASSAVSVDIDRDAPISFSAEFSMRPGPSVAATHEPSVERADLHALLVRGRMRAEIRGRSVDLGEMYPFLFAERMLDLARRALDAWERGQPFFARVDAGGAMVGLRTVAADVPPAALTISPGSQSSDERASSAAIARSRRSPSSRSSTSSSPRSRSDARSFARSSVAIARRAEISASPPSAATSARSATRSARSAARTRASTPRPSPTARSRTRSARRSRSTGAARQRPRGSATRSAGARSCPASISAPRSCAAIASSSAPRSRRSASIARAASSSGAGRRRAPRASSRRRASRASRPTAQIALHDFASGEITLRTWIAPRIAGPCAGAVVNTAGLPKLLIVTEGDKHLVAIDLTSGEARWRYAWGRAGALRLKRVGKLLYVASGDSALTAVDVQTGAVVWRARDRLRFCAGPTVDHEMLFAVAGGVSSAATLHAIDPYSGAPPWSAQDPVLAVHRRGTAARSRRRRSPSPCAIAAASASPAFDRETGAPLFHTETPVAPVGTSWLAVDDLLVGNTPTGELVGVDGALGTLRWKQALGRGLDSDVAAQARARPPLRRALRPAHRRADLPPERRRASRHGRSVRRDPGSSPRRRALRRLRRRGERPHGRVRRRTAPLARESEMSSRSCRGSPLVGVVALRVLSCAPHDSTPAYGPTAPAYGPQPSVRARAARRAPLRHVAGYASQARPGAERRLAQRGASTQHVSALGREPHLHARRPRGLRAADPLPARLRSARRRRQRSRRAHADRSREGRRRSARSSSIPSATGGTWNLDAPTSSNADVALFDAILLVAHNALCVDSRRVFVTGFSNGAYMANQLACKRGERIRARRHPRRRRPVRDSAAPTTRRDISCAPARPSRRSSCTATATAPSPPAEGQKSIDHWSYANRCGGGTTSTLVPPCVALQGCFQPVGVCRIPGLGHGLWSQAGKVTWAFFDALK